MAFGSWWTSARFPSRAGILSSARINSRLRWNKAESGTRICLDLEDSGAPQDSINTGWKNASFRGYADYMQTPAFAENLTKLMELAAAGPTAILCAEAVPWRCHRSLIADALAARGVEVEHILTATSRKPHTYTPFARVDGDVVTYPGLPLSESC